MTETAEWKCWCDELLAAVKDKDVSEVLRIWTIIETTKNYDCAKWGPRQVRDNTRYLYQEDPDLSFLEELAEAMPTFPMGEAFPNAW